MACKDCIHFGICKRGFPWADGKGGGWCQDFKDKNRLIEIPCSVGDTVYELCNNTDACRRCPHYSVFYGMDEMCAKTNDYVMCPTVSDEPLCEKQFYEIISHVPTLNWIFNYRHRFGETVFLTREEAEAALAERIKNESNTHNDN